MAISRASNSSIQGGLPKYNDIWDGFTATSAYDSLGTVVLSSATSTVTFSNIPSTYTHLQIRWSAKLTENSVTYLYLRFNSDSATNYSYHTIYGDGSAAALDSNAPTSYAVAGIAGGTANIFAANVLDILDYSNTNKFKTARVINGVDVNGAGGYVEFTSSNWRSSSAVTSIQIITQNPTTLAASSSFALYGIK